MRILLTFLSLLLIGCDKILANQSCPSNLSANCNCTSQSNQASVVCHYPGLSRVQKVLTSQTGQPQQWVLQSFGIPDNNLTSLPEDYFEGISAISEVDFSGNRFRSVPSALKDLSEVTTINLSSNQLDTIDMTDVSVFGRLRKLDVSANKITQIAPSVPQFSLTQLRQIDLSLNNITSIGPTTLLTFPNLQNLIMNGNKDLVSINDTEFPEHISAVNLNSNNIKTINVCQFKDLIDLEQLSLGDNDLECTCDLVSLYHMIERNRDDGLVHEDFPVWDCMDSATTRTNVSDYSIRKCSTSDTTDTMTSKCKEIKSTLQSSTILDFTFEIASSGSEEIVLEWDSPNSTLLYGFIVVASMTDSDEPIYTSTILHPDTGTHTIQGSVVKSGDFRICMKVLEHNETNVVKEQCKTVNIFSSQIIIGILAGVVFIVPFMAILACIIRMDHKFVVKNRYQQIQQALSDTDKFPEQLGVKLGKPAQPPRTKTELTFTPKGDLPDVTTAKSQEKQLEQPTLPTGTDNLSYTDERKTDNRSAHSSQEDSATVEQEVSATSSIKL